MPDPVVIIEYQLPLELEARLPGFADSCWLVEHEAQCFQTYDNTFTAHIF